MVSKLLYLIIYFGLKILVPTIGTSWDFNNPYFSFFQNIFLSLFAIFIFKDELLINLGNLKVKQLISTATIIIVCMSAIYISMSKVLSVSLVPSIRYPDSLLFILESISVVPFIEEMVYRYCFIADSASKVTRFVLLVFSSCIFAYGHAAATSYNIILLIPFLFLGITLGSIFLVKKNIWYSIFAHFIYNLAVLLLFFA